MLDKGNARPLVAQETGTSWKDLGGDFSCLDGNTESGARQRIFDLLPRGENNAIASRELAKMVGCRSVRELQSRIADEREKGHIILSSCRNGGGYYRPSDGPEGQQEIAAFIQTLRARAMNTLVAIKAARKAIEGVEGQLDLDRLEGLE